MVDFGTWGFCTIPFCGAHWMIDAARRCGFEPKGGSVYQSPPPDYPGLVVTTIRHPADWMVSCWMRKNFGRPVNEHGLDAFVKQMLKGKQNNLWRSHAVCSASSVIRLEDLPWAAVNLFRSLGVGPAGLELVKALPRSNPTPNKLRLSNERRRQILDLEPQLEERYDYY